ncbi:hypothetical protein ASD93_15325 [Microbacterium sp. Root180]|nr:hypothetical protein ASD93_15325 [Microbacterium sp. Root180]
MAPRQRLTVVSAAIAAALTLGGCAPGPSGIESESTAASATPRATDAGSPTHTPIPPTQTSEAPVTETSITITVNDTTVTGVLRASAATASLLEQLPLELSFADFGGQEKIAALPAPLALDGMPSGSSAEPGTIGYYAPDQALVLYYDTVGYYNGIIPLGTFDDVATVRDAPAFTGTLTAN